MKEDFPFEHFLKASKDHNPNNFKNLSGSPKKNSPLNENNLGNVPPVSAQNHEDPASGELSSEEIEIVQKEIQGYLRSVIPEKKFNAFFESTFSLKDIKTNIIEFSVTTTFIKNMIEGHYTNSIKEAVSNVLGKDFEIQISVFQTRQSLSSNNNSILRNLSTELSGPQGDSKITSARESKFTLDLTPTKDDLISKVESKYIDHMNPETNGILIDPSKIFSNFIIGPSNNMACATAKAVSQTPGKKGKYPSLYIHSSSGLGKTHLLHAVANEIREFYPHLIICLITARDFMTEMINSIQNNQINDFRNKFSEKIDVLMIDDIHELKDKQGTQNEFFHIFNELHNKGKQLIFTSDKSPKEIVGIEERIKTRLQWGLVIDIQKPDLETRIAILKRKAHDLDLYCPDDVINLIACSIKTSIRELEGSLVKLSAYADVMKIEIDVDIVKEQLNLTEGEDFKVITIEAVAKATSQYFKIPLVDLKSKSRNKNIARARHIAIYLSRKIIKATQQDIGRFFGGRDHTSIIHACNKIQEQVKVDAALSRDLIYIENNL
jgi:chromosomal replication initiator protein